MSELTPKNKREKFLPEEDEHLRSLVEKHGTRAWPAIAAEMPGRNLRQVRERWKHYLSGERAKAPWSPEEDRLLFEKMHTVGPRWTQLALFFPGRTDIDVKAHWMQSFATYSNLHVANRRKALPLFEPTIPYHVQFAPPFASAPKAAAPRAEEYFAQSRDPSFGSRSYFDLSQWGE
jgi:hypothetical protein